MTAEDRFVACLIACCKVASDKDVEIGIRHLSEPQKGALAHRKAIVFHLMTAHFMFEPEEICQAFDCDLDVEKMKVSMSNIARRRKNLIGFQIYLEDLERRLDEMEIQ